MSVIELKYSRDLTRYVRDEGCALFLQGLEWPNCKSVFGAARYQVSCICVRRTYSMHPARKCICDIGGRASGGNLRTKPSDLHVTKSPKIPLPYAAVKGPSRRRPNADASPFARILSRYSTAQYSAVHKSRCDHKSRKPGAWSWPEDFPHIVPTKQYRLPFGLL